MNSKMFKIPDESIPSNKFMNMFQITHESMIREIIIEKYDDDDFYRDVFISRVINALPKHLPHDIAIHINDIWIKFCIQQALKVCPYDNFYPIFFNEPFEVIVGHAGLVYVVHSWKDNDPLSECVVKTTYGIGRTPEPMEISKEYFPCDAEDYNLLHAIWRDQ